MFFYDVCKNKTLTLLQYSIFYQKESQKLINQLTTYTVVCMNSIQRDKMHKCFENEPSEIFQPIEMAIFWV